MVRAARSSSHAKKGASWLTMSLRTMRSLACALAITLLAPAAGRGQDIAWDAPEAPSEDDLAAARDAYVRGLEAMERGEHGEALAEFRLSYSRSGVPASLFNAALALSRLGRYVEAGAALDVLDERDPPEAVLASAAELRAEVDARIARLILVDVPAGADVTLDDRPIPLAEGASELERPLDPGEHRAVVRVPQLAPFVWRGALLAGERRAVRVELEHVTPAADGDDAPLVAGLIAGAAALIAGVVLAAYFGDRAAQLTPTAPYVVRLP